MTKRTLQVCGRGVAALIVALGVSVQAQAAPIPLGLNQSTPDIAASQIALTYTYDAVAGTGEFVAFSGGPLFLLTSTDSFFFPSGVYELTASILNSGALVNGQLAITTGPGSVFDFFIQVTLNQFGFNPGGSALLEFLGTVTHDAAGVFGVGSTMGIIMHSQIADISFAQNFAVASTGGVTSDNFAAPVPEPATLSLMALGALGFGLARRRR